MTQEDKELLLRDLSARLPYITYVKTTKGIGYVYAINTSQLVELSVANDSEYWSEVFNINEIQPYLRPMSSMTEEERKDFWWNVLDMDWEDNLDYDDESETVPFPFVENDYGFYIDNYYLKDTFAVIDWLNAHHFDYRNLIENGLALKAPEEMYKLKEK